MSGMVVKAICLGKSQEDIKFFQNAYGGFPVIWSALCQKHFGTDWFHLMWQKKDRLLWDLWRDKAVPEYHRSALLLTFDRAYVSDYKRMAGDLRKFFAEFPVGGNRVNHWLEIISIFESEPQYPAIGFWGTTTTDDPFSGGCDEDENELPPDWDKCFDVYSELDGLNEVASGK